MYKKIVCLLVLFLTGCSTFQLPEIECVGEHCLTHFDFTETLREVPLPTYGEDDLGLAKLNAAEIRDAIDPGTALGWLENTFGDAHPKVKKILDSSKIIKARAHLGDGTVANHGCTDKLRDLNLLRANITNFKKVSDLYPNIGWYVSPWLEHGCRDQTLVNKWFTILRNKLPGMRYVCSAYGGYCPANVIHEKHGNKATGKIISNDGDSFFDANSPKYRVAGDDLVLGWTNCKNGRTTGEKTFTPINLRVDWCTQDETVQTIRLLRAPEPRPNIPGCGDFTGWELSKVNAEFYGKEKDDGRGNKPMLILPNRYSRLSVRRIRDNKEVGCYKYYGTYSGEGGGYRHYMGDCSGQTPVKLMNQLESEWGKLVAPGGKCWMLNAIRRLGYYRK